MPTPTEPFMTLIQGLPASMIVLYLVSLRVLDHYKSKANGHAPPPVKLVLDNETKAFFKEITSLVRDGCRDMHDTKTAISTVRDTCIKVDARLPRV